MPETVWTVGHSTHSLTALVALLRKHEIGSLADIRSVPRSHRHPQFDIDALRMDLPARRHRLLAPGAPPAAGGARCLGRRLRTVGACAMEQVAMMCSEALWWRCHRRLVADRLVTAGDTVAAPEGRTAPHHLAPFAVLRPDGQIIYPRPPDG